MLLFDVRGHPFVGAIVPGVAAGLALLFAWPPWGVWWLVFLGPLALVLVSTFTSGPLRSGLGVALGSMVFWGWHHLWIVDVSALGYVPLVAYLALYPGLFVWVSGRIGRRWPRVPMWVVGPVVWVGLEWVRGEIVWHGYPWYLLGHPTIAWAGLASVASIGGVYAVSGLVMLASSLAGDVVRDVWWERHHPGVRRRAGAVVGGVVMVAVVGWVVSPWSPHALRVAGMEGDGGDEGVGRVRVSVVQTSIPQDNKVAWAIEERLEDFGRFLELTRRAASVEPAPDVIVWPETMFPGFSLSPGAVAVERRERLGFPELGVAVTDFHDRLVALQGELGIPMIVGAIGADGLRITEDFRYVAEGVYNSAFVVRDGQVDPRRYDKIHLTPFGEVMPYISAWEWLERALLDLGAAGMSFDLRAGGDPVRLEVPVEASKVPAERVGPGGEGVEEARGILRVATPICFEVSNSDVVRRMVFEGGVRRAGLIVQLTNDGWFGDHEGGRMTHLQIARWRCVELATPMVRAANTGISAAFDGAGRVVRQWAVAPEGGRSVGLGSNPAGILTADVAAAGPEDRTVFVRVGNLAGWVAGVLALVGLGASFVPRERTSEEGRRTRGGRGSSSGEGSRAEEASGAAGVGKE